MIHSKAFKFISKIVLLFACVLNLGGCSLEASIGSTIEVIDDVLAKVSGKEIVPASSQTAITANGYSVQSSISFHSGGADTVTTEDKYVVETGTQSILFKKE